MDGWSPDGVKYNVCQKPVNERMTWDETWKIGEMAEYQGTCMQFNQNNQSNQRNQFNQNNHAK